MQRQKNESHRRCLGLFVCVQCTFVSLRDSCLRSHDKQQDKRNEIIYETSLNSNQKHQSNQSKSTEQFVKMKKILIEISHHILQKPFRHRRPFLEVHTQTPKFYSHCSAHP